MYAWLVLFPLSEGERWAWSALALSGTVGFATFLAYLGYGYLDTWHGIGTLLLLPVFVGGMARTRRLRRADSTPLRWLMKPRSAFEVLRRASPGRTILFVGAAGTAAGGFAILGIGVTQIFVPEDLSFIGLEADRIRQISDRLVPLIAHDRAGFGGAVLTMGLTTLTCLAFSEVRRSLWEAIAIAGGVSLAAAVGVHAVVGYTDLWHLVPPLGAAVSLVVGLALTRGREKAASTLARTPPETLGS